MFQFYQLSVFDLHVPNSDSGLLGGSASIGYLFSIYMYQIQACLSDPLKCVLQPGSSVVLLRSVNCISLASALASVKNSLVNVLGSMSLGLASFLQIGHVPLLCNQ